MSRLSELLRQAYKADRQLGADLEAEFSAIRKQRTFGLVFEPHQPEAVELPGRPIRRGDKVRVLLPREFSEDSAENPVDRRLWRVLKVERIGGAHTAQLLELDAEEPESIVISVDNLVVVAEFRDRIYPGLVETGRVERGGDKPFHTVINSENYHALEMLTYTHRHSIDAIYIDPPYNTGAKDWKYNNDYVAEDDDYRHSKWLAFMERRLKIARELLIPDDSVLIVTIDVNECNRLGLLLEQVYPEARIQMISTVINPKGVSVKEGFRRADEYIFFVMFGKSSPVRLPLEISWSASTKLIREYYLGESNPEADVSPQGPDWTSMMRRGSNAAREDREAMFYPIYADEDGKLIVEIGDALPRGVHEAPHKPGLVAILPIRRNGAEGRWQVGPKELRKRIEQGRVRLGRRTSYGFVVNYLPDGAYRDVNSSQFEVQGRREDGSLIAYRTNEDTEDERIAPTQWKLSSHNSSEYGSTLLTSFLPMRKFPFPKSLYAVEDTLRFFVADKPEAKILDFFSGSGTTAHAAMKLNKVDGGRRQTISVTNNEVSAEEQMRLRAKGLRPGDPEWEALGICDYVTKPRVTAAITGRTPEGKLIRGDYKFTDRFPMSDGFDENAAFFTLTYEAGLSVRHNRAFSRIAPMLWLRAGSRGRIITSLGAQGWDMSESYAVLRNLDSADAFIRAVERVNGVSLAFIVTDDESSFQMVCRELPERVTPLRLYESYLQNFEINTGGR